MFKKLLFQAHWLFGITAGLVLAVVGVTGATLSFEPQILRALNPGVVMVAPSRAEPLTPAELLARVRAEHPGRRVTSLTVSADPGNAARVVLAAPRASDAKPGGAKPGPGGKHSETLYLHPTTGATLGPARGEAFLHFMEDVHRRLAADDAGRRVVGASVLILLVLALSGLYLRWPRRPQDWRAWFLLHPARRGRSFLWDLHSVIGTWVLPFYLLAALTGLFWSYEWYRNGLYALSGVPKPPPAGEARAAGPGGAKASGGAGNPDGPGRVVGGRPEAGGRGGAARGEGQPDPAVDLAGVWSAFQHAVPVYQSATLRLPDRPGKPVQIQYLDPDPAPYRPFNKLSLDPVDFSVQSHERYADKPLNARLMASILALHSGGYFGLIGLTLMMFASLLMPLFAITGWLLYLDRRGKQGAARAARAAVTGGGTNPGGTLAGGKPVPGAPGGGLAAPGGSPAAPGGEWLVGFASQAGFAERLAWQTAGALRAAGVPVSVRPLAGLHPDGLRNYRNALFVVSTFGDGQPPDAARGFARRLLAEAGPSKEAPLRSLRFGLLALGDREYGTFCGFGRALDAGLRRHGARPLFDPVEVNRDDPGSLRDWRARLAGLGLAADDAAGDPDTGRAWAAPAFQPWRLAARRLLNPGSLGGPTYHVELEPPVPAGEGPAAWASGDVVEIRPRHPAARVAAFLATHGLDGAARVRSADRAPGAQPESVTVGPVRTNARTNDGGRGCAGAEPAGVWQPLADALSGLELPPLQPTPGPGESPGKSPGEWSGTSPSGVPASDALPGDASPQAWVDALRPLKARDYSIASLPADGWIHLLIRQERHATPGRADELGVASGWLTQHAPLGAEVELRIRPNRSFHLTPGAAPAVFVGNGTGLAGLRAHLKARAAAGHGHNWLVFGERQAAHDYYYREEIEAWRSQGLIERLDLAFSREPATTGEYVQHRLLAAAGEVRAWVAAGATIYICGSLAGMAGGVEAALEEILGAGAVERLSAEGRYRRDVY